MTAIENFARSARNLRGFTLPELLITVAVGGILLSIAVPSFRSLIVNNRLTTQANEMVAAINFARSEAVKRNSSITLCRASSATATTCTAQSGGWENWIVRTAAGSVARRGTVNTYGGTLVVRSTLVNDQAVFGSDGLARTGNALMSEQQINVCATTMTRNNLRRVVLGAGSRVSTQLLSGGC